MVQEHAAAQSEADFVKVFAGAWQVYDDIYAVDGKPCQIDLTTDAADDGHKLTPTSCGLELGELTGWKIVDKHLVLMAGSDTIAVLGGNQHRVSGDSNIGAPIILDRVGDKGLMDHSEAAHKASGCYPVGFTNTCADDGQLAKPSVPTDGSGARVNVLVNLTARAQARDDADAIGIVPANTCVDTNACVETADKSVVPHPIQRSQRLAEKIGLSAGTMGGHILRQSVSGPR